LKFGMYLPIAREFADARVLAELAEEIEGAGWDGFFVWDHISLEPRGEPHVEGEVGDLGSDRVLQVGVEVPLVPEDVGGLRELRALDVAEGLFVGLERPVGRQADAGRGAQQRQLPPVLKEDELFGGRHR